MEIDERTRTVSSRGTQFEDQAELTIMKTKLCYVNGINQDRSTDRLNYAEQGQQELWRTMR